MRLLELIVGERPSPDPHTRRSAAPSRNGDIASAAHKKAIETLVAGFEHGILTDSDSKEEIVGIYEVLYSNELKRLQGKARR